MFSVTFYLSRQRLPWVYQWPSLRPQTILHTDSDEDVRLVAEDTRTGSGLKSHREPREGFDDGVGDGDGVDNLALMNQNTIKIGLEAADPRCIE